MSRHLRLNYEFSEPEQVCFGVPYDATFKYVH